METRKCTNKLFRLRAKMQGESTASQLRAVSGRLITELEMNSTNRGAVEVFNLARNLREGDVLFAECIRTFKEHTIDGRSWMHRLETSTSQLQERTEALREFVPPTRKPNVRSDSLRPNESDIYGYRPLEYPWKFLSPYEFLQHWRAEPLLVPSYYEIGICSRALHGPRQGFS